MNGKNAIALTFDCAWIDDANGLDILDALKRNNIMATFFLSGPFLFNSSKGASSGIKTASFKLLERIVDDGHEIGNHTETHPHNAAGPNWDRELRNLAEGWDTISKKIYPNGVPANGKMKPFWRAPYGEYDDKSLTVAAKAGFPYHFGWNTDVRDAADLPDCRKKPGGNCVSPEAMTKAIVTTASVNKWSLEGMVVLSHLQNPYF